MGRTTKTASGLTHLQQRFVAEYLVDLNASAAAQRAGYKSGNAHFASGRERFNQVALQLMKKPRIKAAIAAGVNQQVSKTTLTADNVLRELQRIAFCDLRGFFDDTGKLKPISDLTEEQAGALASVEVVRQNLTSGDGLQEWVHKIKLWDKTKALEMLAKYFKLLTERVELHSNIPLQITLTLGQRPSESRTFAPGQDFDAELIPNQPEQLSDATAGKPVALALKSQYKGRGE